MFKGQYYEPDFVSCENYEDGETVKTQLGLKYLNFNYDFDQITPPICYIMRSSNDDNIHKSIKYGVWTSTYENNKLLDDAYTNAKKNNTEVFLFFSVVKSG